MIYAYEYLFLKTLLTRGSKSVLRCTNHMKTEGVVLDGTDSFECHRRLAYFRGMRYIGYLDFIIVHTGIYIYR
jgi:hypothetical protein